METLETASVCRLICTDIGPDPCRPILMTEREEVSRGVGNVGDKLRRGGPSEWVSSRIGGLKDVEQVHLPNKERMSLPRSGRWSSAQGGTG